MTSPAEHAHDDRPHPLQVAAWHAMGSSGRSQLAAELRQKVRLWKLDALRSRHPDWTEDQLRRELARIYIRGHT